MVRHNVIDLGLNRLTYSKNSDLISDVKSLMFGCQLDEGLLTAIRANQSIDAFDFDLVKILDGLGDLLLVGTGVG